MQYLCLLSRSLIWYFWYHIPAPKKFLFIKSNWLLSQKAIFDVLYMNFFCFIIFLLPKNMDLWIQSSFDFTTKSWGLFFKENSLCDLNLQTIALIRNWKLKGVADMFIGVVKAALVWNLELFKRILQTWCYFPPTEIPEK